jgi:hypothetical protein
MDYRYENQQQREQLLTITDRGTMEQLFVSFDFQSKKRFMKT